MKRTLFILITLSFLSANVFASSHTEVNDDTGIWWSAMGKLGGSLVFKTEQGALMTLQKVVKNSEAGQSLKSEILTNLINGNADKASINLHDLMSASLNALGVSADQQQMILMTYSKEHPNTQLNCSRAKQHVFCTIQ